MIQLLTCWCLACAGTSLALARATEQRGVRLGSGGREQSASCLQQRSAHFCDVRTQRQGPTRQLACWPSLAMSVIQPPPRRIITTLIMRVRQKCTLRPVQTQCALTNSSPSRDAR